MEKFSINELIDLATSLINEAEGRNIFLRLLGGVAIFLNSPNGRKLKVFERAYKDLDFVVDPKGAGYLIDVFEKFGWVEDKYFNALHGASRMLFYFGEENQLQADIFIGIFEQCHRLDLTKRLSLSPLTIPISDLLLTKLQIHEINEKDVKDILMLLHDHDFGRKNISEKGELDYILNLTSNNWGWYTSIMDNLDFIKSKVSDYLEGDDAVEIKLNIEWIYENLKSSKKSLNWKIRNIIGRRIQWYDEPEEVRK